MGSVAVLSMASASPLERSFDVLEQENEMPLTDHMSNKEGTPTSIDQTSTTTSLPRTSDIKGNDDTMAKKRKLTAAEKAEAQALKEAEAQKKAEEKARKEEEKRLKEIEKRQKDEEKRVKQEEVKREKEEKQKLRDAAKAEKDAAKAEKDAEKKAKEEAQAKKERAQMKLGAFFKKPTADTESGPSSRRSSILSVDAEAVEVQRQSEPPQVETSAYEKTFPPFFLHAHTTLAPVTLHSINEARAQWASEQIYQGNLEPQRRPETILGKRKRTCYVAQPQVKKLLSEMQGTSASNPIDTETSRSDAAAKALRSLPIKYIKFREDVRPPWIGTWGKAPEGRRFAALARNPFRRELPNVNYDYDSEAEWEEPEEGEELGSEGEEEEDDEDEDMEEFLDDEAAEAAPKRKQLVDDLEPVCTGLMWEGLSTCRSTQTHGSMSTSLEPYRMGILLESAIRLPIDPFSTSYWEKETPKNVASKANTADTAMHPPTRQPLNTIAGPNTAFLALKSDSTTKPGKTIATAKPLPAELMAEFKEAVAGSNLSKVGLVEVLKKNFPQVTKKTVEQTLLQIAQRVGKKEAEKSWQLIERLDPN